MKILVFDIFGDYGHFRRFFTTSSPLTFPFPPPPTVRGILGAICGIDKESYLQVFNHQDCTLAIGLLSPVKKTRLTINLINTKDGFWTPIQKGSHEPRTQIRTEFLKDSAFRIYVTHKDAKIFNDLLSNIEAHKTVYTLSLGLSELLCGFKYLYSSEGVEKENGEAYISSVIPLNSLNDGEMIFEEGKKYYKERIPVVMNQERVVEKYEDLIFEAEAKPIKVRNVKHVSLGSGENIIFL